MCHQLAAIYITPTQIIIILTQVAIIFSVCFAIVPAALALPLPSQASSSSARQHHCTSAYTPIPRRSCRSIDSHHPLHINIQNEIGFTRILTEVFMASTKNNDEDNIDRVYDENERKSRKPKTSVTGGVGGRIENMARDLGIADETYQFGDLTRSVISGAIDVSEDAVRTVTGNREYQFGDITKNVTKAAVNVTEDTIRSITGDEEYKFGDITKGVVSDVTDTAENWLLTNEVDVAFVVDLVATVYQSLPSSGLFRRFSSELLQSYPDDNEANDTFKKKKNGMVRSLQLIAFIGLPLQFILNLFHSSNIIASWAYTWWNMGVSPLESQVAWQLFLHVHQTLRIFIGPVLLPVQVAMTFFLAIVYRDFVILFLEQKVISKIPWYGMRIQKRYPVLSRIIAMLMAYSIGNCLLPATLTLMGCTSVGAVYRLSMPR